MIVTLTPNPSVDRTIAVDQLRHGEVHRATSSRIDPGGKGVNVSRALAAFDVETTAVLPLGGPEGRLMEALLDTAAVARVAVPVAGSLRMNVTVVEPDGTTTKLNEPGPELTDAELDALVAATLQHAAEASWLVGCGSLAPSMPTDLYADLVHRCRELGVRIAIDSSGAAMRAAVAARPDLIKPNHEELAELVGRELPTLADVVEAARGLVASGIATVVVSLGGDGAVLVDATQALHATTRIPRRVSTVGAGDCFLAGTLAAMAAGRDARQALVTGSTWGSAAVTLPGSRVPTPADLGVVQVELSDNLDLRLTHS